jgi:hypothetical protein
MRFRSRLSAGLTLAAAGLATAAIIVPTVGPTGHAAAAVTATQATAAASVIPLVPYPATGTYLYVDNYDVNGDSVCSDSGPGSESDPFCTIAKAASVVQPGETVVVEPGTYKSSVTISAQGTQQEPITFDAIGGALIEGPSGVPAVTISGARDVKFDGFSVLGAEQGFYVTGSSSGITIDGGWAQGLGAPAIEVDGTSSDVTVSQMAINSKTSVQVDPGASGVVISDNSILAPLENSLGVLVNGAPGTDIAGNTILTRCSPGISITGASTGASVEDNIVQPAACGSGTNLVPAGIAISVSADSEASSVVDYNVIDPTAGGPLYSWGGASYSTLVGFRTASGQGANDIAANPELGAQVDESYYVFYYPLDADSPAIDSADASAPGELPTDQIDNPRTDDPDVTNAGTGVVGYCDRGAIELQGGVPMGQGASAVSSGPLTTTFTVDDNPAWKTNGQPARVVQVYFGDGTPTEVTRALSITHTFTTAGLHQIDFSEYQGSGSGYGEYEASTDAIVGADYTPITPDRILDTRYGTGTGTAAPVAANGTLTLPIPTTDGVPATEMSAVVMNVTVTSPTKPGNLEVYPDTDGSVPTVSNLNFSAGETVPNLVTVQDNAGYVSFHNNSGGTVQVIADLEGFYGPGGYGYQPGTPDRVLDTRTGTGASGPVPAEGVLKLNLSGTAAAGASAVVMNLTVTAPQKGGHLTVYPDGAAEPNASNLNFSAGETVPNLVIVPVTDGVVDIANVSPGTVQLVADVEGKFSSTGPDSFVPITPTRLLDTRVTRNPLAADTSTSLGIETASDAYSPQATVAAVDNVTVTAPAKPGNLIVYPAGSSRPLASSLNFSVSETVPNLVMAKAGTNGEVSYYNQSPGQLQLIVDEYGYYINAG